MYVLDPGLQPNVHHKVGVQEQQEQQLTKELDESQQRQAGAHRHETDILATGVLWESVDRAVS